jgi:hypothetical protein
LALSGCNLGQGYVDFGKDVSQPENVVIDSPGKKISDGQISGMLVDPWGDNGAVVVGFRYLDDGPHLRMQPFDGSKGCNVGRAYRCIVFNRLPNEPQLIAYLDDVADQSGRGTLNFTDHSCNIAYGGIKNAELPSRLFDSPPGFVVAAGDQLLDIDPYRKKTRVIADKVSTWSGPGTPDNPIPIWLIANGQLVVLDQNRQEALRLGKDVTEVVFMAADPTQGLYLVDGGSLTRYVEATGTQPKILANDVCGASLGAFGVSYYSPCGERKLVMQDPDKGTKYEIDSGVGRLLFAQPRTTADGTRTDIDAIYTKASTTDAGYEDLWLKLIGEEPRIWQHRLGRFISGTAGPSPTLLAIVDSDGSTGRLLSVDSTGEQTLCEGVSVAYPVEANAGGWLLLTNVSNGFGTLIWLNAAGERKTVVDRLAIGGVVKVPEKGGPNGTDYSGITDDSYYNLRAFLTDIVDGAGSITLFDPTKLDSLVKFGTRVPDGRFDFFKNMTAVAYLDDIDSKTGTGTLSLFQTRIGALTTVSKNALEYSELLWPYEGIIYTVLEGDKYSLWAARAKP